jgi:hypothetical protein
MMVKIYVDLTVCYLPVISYSLFEVNIENQQLSLDIIGYVSFMFLPMTTTDAWF